MRNLSTVRVLGLVALVSIPALAAPTVDSGAVKALLCEGPCDFALAPAFVGKDGEGREVFVVGVKLPEVKAEEGFDTGEPCIPEAYSLLHVASGEKPGPKSLVEKVVSIREDGCSYGMGGGSESVSLDKEMLALDTDNGSNWRESTAKRWRLVPKLALVSESSTSYSRITLASQTTRIDHERKVTRLGQTIPLCSDGEDARQPDWACDVVPRAPDALTVDSAATQGPLRGGFVTYGKPGDPADAQLTVSAIDDRTIVVEVEEPSFTQGTKSWVFDDHLELWAAEAELPAGVVCVVKPGQRVPDDMSGALPVALQWGVRVTDGAVFVGAGKPKKSPTVERTELSPTRVRLQIKLPFKPALLSVAYSDSDDGKTQKRMIATSNVKFGDARSLGIVAK